MGKSLAICLTAFALSFAIAKILADKHDYVVDPNQVCSRACLSLSVLQPIFTKICVCIYLKLYIGVYICAGVVRTWHDQHRRFSVLQLLQLCVSLALSGAGRSWSKNSGWSHLLCTTVNFLFKETLLCWRTKSNKATPILFLLPWEFSTKRNLDFFSNLVEMFCYFSTFIPTVCNIGVVSKMFLSGCYMQRN